MLPILLIAAFALAVAAALVWSLRPVDAAPPAPPVRIAIVGGGFAGVYAARELERELGHRDDVELTLFNDENYFVFQPMLPEVISGSIGTFDTVIPLRDLLKRTQVQVRPVESIDLQKQTITAAPGLHPHAHTVEWDHLVMATGSVTDFRGLPGLPEHALPFKNLGDALRVRNHVIHALEEADIESEDRRLREELLTFVVAGGGFSGVEVVAELNDFVRSVAKRYRRIDPDEIRVVLLHSQDRILPEVSARLAAYAQRQLERRGVELMLGTRLVSATERAAVLKDGRRIATRTLISTIPSQPHPLIDALDVAKARGGKLQVDGTLKLHGRADVWALGDCALVPFPDGTACPPTAQHATRQARTLARNLAATIGGRRLRAFQFRGLGKMGSLGSRNAVAELFGVSVSGFLAWFLWRTIYLFKLPGWGRRLKVAASWTFDLFLQPELVQLRLGNARGIQREHFEAGELVFEPGDVADRVYVIARGSAEVVSARGEPIARLGEGEIFGEIAILDGRDRMSSVRCIDPLDVLVIPRREFHLLAAALPGLRESFERLRDRRQLANQQVA
jgi:NADH dehydrogenase